MQGSTSKLRNVYGEENKIKFDDVKPWDTLTDGSLIDANTHFIAVSWNLSGGGGVGVLDAMNFMRIPNDFPLIRGHNGPVNDVKFSPFKTNLLATASDDATVKLWEIPEGGLTASTTAEQQKFTGHSKKVGIVNFNPTVAEVIASSSFDNGVHIWNICNADSLSKFQFGNQINSLDWNHNGSLLGLTTKEKLVYVVDPRGQKTQLSCAAHDSTKAQKMMFLDENFLFTCGFSKSSREIKLFDMRKFTDHVQQIPVDSLSGLPMLVYDKDIGLIYVGGRGEGTIKYYDYSQSTIKFANEFKSSTQQKGLAAFPKRAMNFNKCEISRIAKLTGNSVEYVSIYVPKRNEGYDASIYPDCLAGEPALGVDAWLSGENKDPIRKNITSLENKWSVGSDMNFEKKVEEVKVSKPVEETNNSNVILEQVNLYKEQSRKLQEQNEVLAANNQQLEKANRELELTVESLRNEIEILQKQLSSDHGHSHHGHGEGQHCHEQGHGHEHNNNNGHSHHGHGEGQHFHEQGHGHEHGNDHSHSHQGHGEEHGQGHESGTENTSG